jgi:hypothetical protein
MAVKTLQREVTSTKVEYAQLKVVEGQPQVVKGDLELIGNISEEKVLKHLTKEVGSGVTILSLEVNTQKYEMPVEEFIQLAKVVEA